MKIAKKIISLAGIITAFPALAVEVVPYTGQTINSIALKIIDWFMTFAGGVAVLFIIFAGLQFTASAGNKDRLDKAKKTLTYAVLGIIVVILSKFIVAFINTNINAVL